MVAILVIAHGVQMSGRGAGPGIPDPARGQRRGGNQGSGPGRSAPSQQVPTGFQVPARADVVGELEVTICDFKLGWDSEAPERLHGTERRNRKSTRLNSSH